MGLIIVFICLAIIFPAWIIECALVAVIGCICILSLEWSRRNKQQIPHKDNMNASQTI